MRKPLAALALLGPLMLGMGGCANLPADAQRIAPALQTACNEALTIATIAGLVPGVGAILPYINAGCATAEGLTKLAADPTSTQWVGQLIGQVKALAAAAHLAL